MLNLILVPLDASAPRNPLVAYQYLQCGHGLSPSILGKIHKQVSPKFSYVEVVVAYEVLCHCIFRKNTVAAGFTNCHFYETATH